jgi:hypothetical protein
MKEKDPTRPAGSKIPEQARDCGPQVDTWPIVDTQVGDAPKPKTDEYGRELKGSAES